ncbi:acyl-CoA dehydrogenase family protein [Nannocystis sp.]|uniref:acyl-CoA dehydrogenase family protein n=1 Tax=Nannocystis sp. TaxID=1962667 RepID=UPI0025CEC25D|nr:acyl-CoA dehydrogenase family protein [Nannocystis sp.]
MSFFQDAPGNPDLFLADPTLRAELARRLPASLLALAQARCAAIGVASTELLPRLAAQAEAQPPEHVPYDPWGRRVDEIRTSPAWEALRVFSATQGLVATGYEAGLGEHRRVIQAALLHLFSASSATYSCPLAMTDAAARVLLDLAPASLRERLVAGLTTTDPARFITSGQWMTERTGGSDVGGTETVARPAGVVGGEQRYTLHGVKWFTSATTSEMALTLARIDDGAQAPVAGSRGLSLFCVEVTREAGRGWQGITVNRLKDKLGTRALPTAELTLDGAPATLIGEPGRGVANISGMLNVTRLYNAIASASGMRRACALARDYAERRVAFGRKLVDLPLHAATLADMEAETAAVLALVMECAALLGRSEAGTASEDERRRLRALIPLAKLTTAKQAVATASEALECFGGAGYVEDTGLPRLLRDAQVLAIWEGTTNVLSLDVLRAEGREGAFSAVLADLSQRSERLARPLNRVAATAVRDGVRGLVAAGRQALSEGGAALEAGARKLALRAGHLAEALYLAETAAVDEVAAEQFRRFVALRIG